MPSGGKRVGAGRKNAKGQSGSLTRRPPASLSSLVGTDDDLELTDALGVGQEALVRTVLANQERLTLAMIDLACGVMVEEEENVETEAGTITQKRVYKAPPDRQAIAWLVEMAHGKATQKQVVQADTTINVIHRVPRAHIVPEPEDELTEADFLPVPAEPVIEADYYRQPEEEEE